MTDPEELRRRVAEQAADADPAGRAALESVLTEMSPEGATQPAPGRRTGASPARIALGSALIFWAIFAMVVALAETSIVIAVVGTLLVAGGAPLLHSSLHRRRTQLRRQRP